MKEWRIACASLEVVQPRREVRGVAKENAGSEEETAEEEKEEWRVTEGYSAFRLEHVFGSR